MADTGTKTTRSMQVHQEDARSGNEDIVGDVNMEAAITKSDLVHAGGLGSKDDIGSVIPIAADSTDFEGSLLNAQKFEAFKEETQRPGLGWTEDKKPNSDSPVIPQ